MKRILHLLFAVSALWGCNSDYDDSALTGRVDDLENRVAKLEELCKQMNTYISSLQILVDALQNKDYITGVSPLPRTEKQLVTPFPLPKAHRLRFTTDRMEKTVRTANPAKTGKTALPRLSE